MISYQQTPETFFVDEVLAYEPTGVGDHVFANIRKVGVSTVALKRRLSEALGVPLREIRHAGKKDTAATATQWLSWPRKAQKTPGIPAATDAYQILKTVAHDHALAIGHVKGNRFRLKLTGPEQAAPFLTEPSLVFPNVFGPQRFGSGARSWQASMRPGAGPKPTRDEVSVRQARLFNQFFLERVGAQEQLPAEDEIWMIAGAKRFFQAPLDDDLQARFEAGEITPSGPIFGYKVVLRPAEVAFLADRGMSVDDFRQWGKAAKGARRHLWAKVQHFESFHDGTSWVLDFQLPAGAYATVFLLHLLSPQVLLNDPKNIPNFTQQVHWQRGKDDGRLEMV